MSNLVDEYPILASVKPKLTGPDTMRPAAVRIQVEPLTPGLRIWAFVSATNNETQHVTAILPAQ